MEELPRNLRILNSVRENFLCRISPKLDNNVESKDTNLLPTVRKIYLSLMLVYETLSHSVNIY